eukprot:1943140-Pyramimonas_sp.AAC.1
MAHDEGSGEIDDSATHAACPNGLKWKANLPALVKFTTGSLAAGAIENEAVFVTHVVGKGDLAMCVVAKVSEIERDPPLANALVAQLGDGGGADGTCVTTSHMLFKRLRAST